MSEAGVRFLPWVAALAAAAATTAGVQACDPPWALVSGLVLVGAVGVIAASRGSRAGAWVGLLALSLLAVARPLAVDGVPYTHDGAAHAWRLWAIARSVAAGDLWPRWLPEIGLGLPTLQYYPPMAYVGPALAMVAGLATPHALTVGAWLPGVVGAAGVFWVLRERGLLLATLGAAAFLLAPFRLLDAGYRFALGELWGLALLLPFWHLARRVLGGNGGGPQLAVVSALLAVSHPVTGLSALWALPWLMPAGGMRRVGRLAAAGLLGAAIAGAHLLPVVFEADEVRLSDAIPGAGPWFGEHALGVSETAVRTRWEGRQLHEGRSVEGDRLSMPAYLGWGLMLPVLWVLVRKEEDAAWARAAAWCWLCSLHPLATGIGYLGVLSPLQFPFRLLGPATVAAIPVFVGWAAPMLRERRWLAPALVLGLAADAAPGFGAPSWMEWPSEGITRHRLVGGPPGCRTDEWGWAAEPLVLTAPAPRRQGWAGDATGDLPMRVQALLMPPARLDSEVANVWRVPPELWTDETVEQFRDGVADRERAVVEDAGIAWWLSNGATDGEAYRPRSRARLIVGTFEHDLAAEVRRDGGSAVALTLPAGHPGGTVVLVEQALAGWRARVDGGPWGDAGRSRGRLAVEVSAGAARVELRYTSATAARRGGILASGLGLLVLGVWWRRDE